MKQVQFFVPFKKIPTTTHQQKKINFKNKAVFEPLSLKLARECIFSHLIPFCSQNAKFGASALRLEVMWLFQTKDKKKQGTYKVTRPDLDNQQKLLQDVMTELGFWNDDAQIVSLVLEKRWTDRQSGIFIRITELPEKIGDEYEN